MAKKSALAWSPIRDLMKSVGAQIVARDAVSLLINHLVEVARDITVKALGLTRHAKRTKLSADDISLTLKLIK